MYGYDILCGISKGTLKSILHMQYNIEIFRALRFKSSYAFLNPPRHNGKCSHISLGLVI